ncbi:polysaccharide biosynthesis tyrosine autokinase [uncultured Bifidobacterium sp.]|uniref:polysaccharide biosynthesis tyrosine autokinase n=1 Tax=uncultured Bifidobacterium sp. TaxID=165187 RepID=UPI00262B8D23|nr:polysaccharide biosynthesis tyrosine autokinase [uncultured Bifidobacterium sp.]
METEQREETTSKFQLREGKDDDRDGTVSLSDLLQVIRKHMVTALVTFALVVVGAGAFTMLSPTKYSATAEVFVTYSSTAAGTDDISSITSVSTYISNQIKSYPTLATTESVLQPVISDLGLNTTVSALASTISVTNPSDTAFINITVQDGDASRAASVANAVATSLSDVVENSLYSQDEKSPVKLSVVQQATVPQSPSSPKVNLYMMVGILLGIVFGIVAALLKDLLAPRIEDARDLQDIVEAPIVGRVPRNDALNDSTPIVISTPSGSLAEEFRRIRTNLSFTAPVEGTHSRLVVVGAVGPNEGKTTCAVNIAAAFAETGSRVLLIDADLRHPSVAAKLDLEGGAGLTHVLSGQADVKDVVERYWKPNFHVMLAGPKPPNASVLLNSPTMFALLRQALLQYDYVVIDTAPMVVADEAALFGSIGRGVLMVSGRDMTSKRELKDVSTQLSNLDVPITGFVFNYAKDNRKSNGYYGNYYYDDDSSTSSGGRSGKSGKSGRKSTMSRGSHKS